MPVTKTRDVNLPMAEFDMPLSEALIILLPASELRAGDNWSIHTLGNRLVFTRQRAAIPNNGQGPTG
jgi:hypothetical protein